MENEHVMFYCEPTLKLRIIELLSSLILQIVLEGGTVWVASNDQYFGGMSNPHVCEETRGRSIAVYFSTIRGRYRYDKSLNQFKK